MIYAHPLDPPHLHVVATTLGQRVAEGKCLRGEAEMVIRDLADASAGVDKRGLQARLSWTLRDSHRFAVEARDAAARRIRDAIRPLFRAGATKGAIEEAAGAANADALDWADIYPILHDELVRAAR